MRWSRAAAEISPQLNCARLELEIIGDRLEAAVSGDIFGTSRVEAARTLDFGAVEAIAADIAAILNRATRWGDADQGSRELLRPCGELLFDAVLPIPIKRALRGAITRAHGVPPALAGVLDPSLLHLPWELMHSGQDFLGVAFALGRIISGLEPEPAVVGRRGTTNRALVLCDPRGDLIGSYYEGLTLRDELSLNSGWEVDLRSSEVGLADVRRLLREYDLVHFAGHAEPGSETDATERGWWLQDGVLGPDAIGELVGGRRFPRLIFSNACRSAGGGIVAGAREGGVRAMGLARAFLEAGVEHYVGTIEDVPDEPASLFALTFYTTLMARPRPGIGEAVRQARCALAERYGAESVYWASWVLYGWPDAAGAPAIARGSEEAPPPTPPVAPARGLAAVAARVRGAVAEAPTARVPSRRELVSFWRGALSALGLCASVAVVAVLVGLLGRAPPTPWIEAGGLGRVQASGGPASIAVARQATAVSSFHASASLTVVRERGAASLAPGPEERFRLRVVTPTRGFIGLWRVDGAGAVQRIDRSDRREVALRPVGDGEILELPGDSSWWSIASEGPAERYYLAWRQVAPIDGEGFFAELDREIARIERALEATARLGRAPAGVLEGLIGIREGASAEEIRERFEETLEDRFDTVVRRVVSTPQ